MIKESKSPWAAPTVLVRKKDRTLRFCVDYRKLNAVNHKDAFPLSRIEETLTSLSRAEWFSTLDLASGYWQVGMHPQDQEKNTFIVGKVKGRLGFNCNILYVFCFVCLSSLSCADTRSVFLIFFY